MGLSYGTYDSLAKDCILLYDFFSAGSFIGEPTSNLFLQPPATFTGSGSYGTSTIPWSGGGTVLFLKTENPIPIPDGATSFTGYLSFTQLSGGGTPPSTAYRSVYVSGDNNDYYMRAAASVSSSSGIFNYLYNGFQVFPTATGRAFYKLDYYNDLNNQGTFSQNATGVYSPTDSIYKYKYTGTQTDVQSNKHGFNINIIRGETYTASTEVFISPDHPRTGIIPILSFVPNLSGTFATLTGTYDCSLKGTWQSISQKIFVPVVANSLSLNPVYFDVTVDTKTASNPYYNSGSAFGYKIGSSEAKTLSLYKGATYVFVQSNQSNLQDELYLSTTIDSGGGANAYNNGFSYFGNKGVDGYAVFNVPYNAPPVLYYNSRQENTSFFGGKINIIGGYNSGNTGNVGNINNTGNAGNGGNAGNISNTGTSSTSEFFAVCFDPTRKEFTSSNLNGGYILYKNMQFEKNKKMFKGIVHKTQFTSTSRSDVSSILDLTGNDYHSNQINSNYDNNAYLFFSKRANLLDGGFIDVNLKANKAGTFLIGNQKTQTYDFWIKQTAASNSKAYLFSRSNAFSGELFLENEGYLQSIYIQNKRVFFTFTTPELKVFSGYTNQLININVLYNIIVAINLNAVLGNKAKIYINGQEVDVFVYSILPPPVITSIQRVVGDISRVGNVDAGFKGGQNLFYCISSYDPNGESARSEIVGAPSDDIKNSIRLNWRQIEGANGYYIYRSYSSSFGPQSLIANINNQRINYFIDNNFQTSAGYPKTTPIYSFEYEPNALNFVDDANAKVCFGDYPITTNVPNYFEGYIYRIAIYKSTISAIQAFRNYNSFYYRFKQEDPDLIKKAIKPRTIIYKNVEDGINNNAIDPGISPSVTPSVTRTPSVTPSVSVSSSITPSISLTPSRTATQSITPSISNTPGLTPTPSVSLTPTSSVTPSVTPSESVTPSISLTPTRSVTPSISLTPTRSITPSVTPSVTPSESVTPSISLTPTRSVTPSVTPSESVTPSISLTPTRSVTPSVTPSESVTPSVSNTPGISSTPSVSLTPTRSVTPSVTPSESVTPSISLTPTRSVTPSVTPSITPSDSVTPSISLTPTRSVTPSVTPSESVTPSVSNTPGISPTPSVSLTPTRSVTPSVTPSITRSESITPSVSVSPLPASPSPTPSISLSPLPNPGVSVTPSVTPSST